VGGWNIAFTTPWSERVLILIRVNEEERVGRWIPGPLGRYGLIELEEGQRGHFGM